MGQSRKRVLGVNNNKMKLAIIVSIILEIVSAQSWFGRQQNVPAQQYSGGTFNNYRQPSYRPWSNTRPRLTSSNYGSNPYQKSVPSNNYQPSAVGSNNYQPSSVGSNNYKQSSAGSNNYQPSSVGSNNYQQSVGPNSYPQSSQLIRSNASPQQLLTRVRGNPGQNTRYNIGSTSTDY